MSGLSSTVSPHPLSWSDPENKVISYFSTPEYLAQSLRSAASNRYALGIKLVRGAYHEQEVMPYSPSFPLTTTESWPPVFTSKEDTDRCYDAAITELVRAVGNADGRGPRVGVLLLPTTQGAATEFSMLSSV